MKTPKDSKSRLQVKSESQEVGIQLRWDQNKTETVSKILSSSDCPYGRAYKTRLLKSRPCFSLQTLHLPEESLLRPQALFLNWMRNLLLYKNLNLELFFPYFSISFVSGLKRAWSIFMGLWYRFLQIRSRNYLLSHNQVTLLYAI